MSQYLLPPKSSPVLCFVLTAIPNAKKGGGGGKGILKTAQFHRWIDDQLRDMGYDTVAPFPGQGTYMLNVRVAKRQRAVMMLSPLPGVANGWRVVVTADGGFHAWTNGLCAKKEEVLGLYAVIKALLVDMEGISEVREIPFAGVEIPF